MIGLIITIALICIISILLLSSLKITLNISDGVVFYVSFLGIRLFKLDKTKKTKAKKQQPREEKKDKKLSELLKDYVKGKSKKKIVEEIFTLLKELCVKFGKLLKHLRFKKLEFNLTVSSEDAATTAIRYGTICSVVYSICGMLKAAYNFDAKKVRVSADFTSEEIKLFLVTTIKIRLVFVIGFALSTAFSIIKLKLGEVKNGRA